jgi:tetratricopeptide (TPR) repeat protein
MAGAKLHYIEAVRLNPADQGDVLENLASIYYHHDGDHIKALSYWERAVALLPSARLHRLIASVLLDGDHIIEANATLSTAAHHLHSALKLSPEDTETAHGLAAVLGATLTTTGGADSPKQMGGSLGTRDTDTKPNDPRIETVRILAETSWARDMARAGAADEALGVLDVALEFDGKNHDLRIRLASLLYDMGEQDEARSHLLQVHAADPTHHKACKLFVLECGFVLGCGLAFAVFYGAILIRRQSILAG